MRLNKQVPMLNVQDVAKTVLWYQRLGFQVVATNEQPGCEMDWAFLVFDGVELMLNAGGHSHHGHRRDVVIWLYTDNIDALHTQLKERVHITDKPADASYGVREFGIEDPNGFELMFAQRLEE